MFHKRIPLSMALPALLLLPIVGRAQNVVPPVEKDGVLVYNLMTNTTSNFSHQATAKFALPTTEIASARLRVTAVNDDAKYRRSVHLEIDGIGDDISCSMAKTMTDGYIAPKESKSWEFDLSRRYRMLVHVGRRFIPARLSESVVSYVDTLRRSKDHSVKCWVSASDKDAPNSRVSVELIVTPGKAPAARTTKLAITSDVASDPRVSIALDKLRDAIGDGAFAGYRYVIGKSVAKPYVKQSEIAGLGSQGFVIKTVAKGKTRTIVVTGSDSQGIAYGIFRLARIMLSAPQKVDTLALRMVPALPIRDSYEEHTWANPKEIGDYKALLHKYVEEGINVLDLPVGWFLPPPYYLKGAPTQKQEDLAFVRKMIDYAHSLGIKVCLCEDMYLNPIYNEPKENLKSIDVSKLDEIHAVMEGGHREPLLLCLSNPVSRDILVRSREILYKGLPNVDAILIYAGDPGGCCEAQCLPHGKKIIEYLNELYVPLMKRVAPKSRIVLTTWGVGYDDTEYIVKHIKELPSNVVALQLPPTSMVSGTFLTFEPKRGELIKEAAKTLPVIIQQFHEGVGFRNGWVDGWEHPMPHEMEQNFRGSYIPNSGVKGAYGSSFEIGHQLVDMRLGMEWAWTPNRSGMDILTELGNEQFGVGVGPAFARAMYAMDDYWYKECRRFAYDSGGLNESDLADVKQSLAKAQSGLKDLMAAEPFVQRNRLYYKGFVELAEMQAATSRLLLARGKAADVAQSGDTQGAIASAEGALIDSRRVVDLAELSERYAWLTTHPWWSDWAIGKRPQRIAGLIEELRSPVVWEPLSIPDPSFEAKSWESGGAGAFAYSTDAHTGSVSAKLTASTGEKWVVLSPSTTFAVKPNERYRVQFWAKVLSGEPQLYLDWSGSGTAAGESVDGENVDISVRSDSKWHKYTADVTVPNMKSAANLQLRFVAYGSDQVLLIDDISLMGKAN